ncbi:MAG TPA: hypothetical protein VLC46_07920 [Thermoanaerobaculia bacterium]|jgi:hypothetical protein|nr:hypothetical protein [Thermoanaerobaculia bacterium]
MINGWFLMIVLASRVAAIDVPRDIHYLNADAAMRSQQWNKAISELQLSVASTPHATSAYLLAIAYSQLSDHADTELWASAALSWPPKLPDEYRKDATVLLAWARTEVSVHSVRANFAQSINQTTKDVGLIQAEIERLTDTPMSIKGDGELEALYIAKRDAILTALTPIGAASANEMPVGVDIAPHDTSLNDRILSIGRGEARPDVTPPVSTLPPRVQEGTKK